MVALAAVVATATGLVNVDADERSMAKPVSFVLLSCQVNLIEVVVNALAVNKDGAAGWV